MNRFAFLPLATFLSLLYSTSCASEFDQIERDRQVYESISAARPPETLCQLGDSGDVQRRQVHPLGSVGGWYGPDPVIDKNRHHDSAHNQFDGIGGELAGYVHFPVSGKLTMRSYDDLYGNVYCGWSPTVLDYEPQSQPVYALFSLCSVGDGGLDQVHELCWFPDDEEQGYVIYSSAFPGSTELKPHDLFLPRHLGTLVHTENNRKIYYFNDREADRILGSLLIAGRLPEARELITDTLDTFRSLPSAIDGSTEKPIPPQRFHCEEWVNILLINAGTNLFREESKSSLLDAKQLLIEGGDSCNHHIDDLIDHYLWTVERVQGGNVSIPPVTETENWVTGYDPRVISEILSDPGLTETNLSQLELSFGGQSSYFWLGLREYLNGNGDEASRYLSLFMGYMDQSGQDHHRFELAAAASLQNSLSKRLERR